MSLYHHVSPINPAQRLCLSVIRLPKPDNKRFIEAAVIRLHHFNARLRYRFVEHDSEIIDIRQPCHRPRKIHLVVRSHVG